MRIGLLGGSFNPIHRGHLAVARAARAALHLDRIVLVPSARPPHKSSSLASAEDRFAMASLAAADPVFAGAGFEVSDVELTRTGPSFTIDTLRWFRERDPAAELFFVVGADSVPELKTWRDARELFRLARFAVAARPGHDLEGDLAALARDLGAEAAQGLRERVVPIEPDPLSATEIRRRLRDGDSIEGLVPDAVRRYIHERGLYGARMLPAPGRPARETRSAE